MQDAVTDSLILKRITTDHHIVTQSLHNRVNQLHRPDRLIFLLLHINVELIFTSGFFFFFFLSFRNTAVNFMRRMVWVILGHQSSTVLAFWPSVNRPRRYPPFNLPLRPSPTCFFGGAKESLFGQEGGVGEDFLIGSAWEADNVLW